jgi:hypothetical protein
MSTVEQRSSGTSVSDIAAPKGRWSRAASPVGLLVVFAGVVVLLMWPLLTFDPRLGGSDWDTQFWLIEQAAEGLRHHHHPSFFVSSDQSVFYPMFAFYGGTLFGLGGAMALLLGSSIHAYVLGYVLALCAAYGGWYWLGRQLGLGWWVAHLPAVLFVTSPCYLTLLYGRGDWPEFVGVSMMSLLIASAVSVLRADRLRAGPAAALALSTTLFCGSHNLTLLWGATFLTVAAVSSYALAAPVRRAVTRRGVLRVLAVSAPALLVNAWFLVPDLAYQSQTVVVWAIPIFQGWLRNGFYRPSWSSLFSLSRDMSYPASPGLVLALPVLGMAWVATAGLFIAWRRPTAPSTRVVLALCGLGAVVVVLMLEPEIVLAMPKPYTLLQFATRLESYLLLMLTGAAIVALRSLRGIGGRSWIWVGVLIPVVALSVLGAAKQVRHHPVGLPLQPGFSDPSFAALDYKTVRLPILEDQKIVGAPRRFSTAAAWDGRASISVDVPPEAYVQTNLATIPELVQVKGARVALLNRDAQKGYVLQVSGGASGGAHRITVTEAQPFPVVLGRALSLIGLGGLAVVFGSIAVGARRRRRAAV